MIRFPEMTKWRAHLWIAAACQWLGRIPFAGPLAACGQVSAVRMGAKRHSIRDVRLETSIGDL
jgi:hypothetical protein